MKIECVSPYPIFESLQLNVHTFNPGALHLRLLRTQVLSAAVSVLIALPAIAALPAPPAPPENPITEPKRVLGKILFWDEQVSADNTVACGTCHMPASGGVDPRSAIHPGTDGEFGTADDVHGSPGVRRHDRRGNAIKAVLFGHELQVTDRNSMSFFGGLWSDTNFWDGRAGGTFVDPVTRQVAIRTGGALESQAIVPIMNSAEMSKDDNAWEEVVRKLSRSQPLALARRLPPDTAAAISKAKTYPALFDAAFGDPAITPTRIAFAIAAYERTLIPDQTPWDLHVDKGLPLDPAQQMGLAFFESENCVVCHTPPLFTNNKFFNVGLRPAYLDRGRQKVTLEKKHGGQMKTPSLRNVGLRPRFMHSGELTDLDQVIDLYARPRAPRDDLPDGTRYQSVLSATARSSIKAFLVGALTDPRVAAEKFPFDRPILRSEQGLNDTTAPSAASGLKTVMDDSGLTLSWRPASDNIGVADYVVRRNGDVIAFVTDAAIQLQMQSGIYSVVARDAAGNSAKSAYTVVATLIAKLLAGLAMALSVALCMWLVSRVAVLLVR